MARVAPKPWDHLDTGTRRRIEEGRASGMYPETTSMCVVAHSPEALAAMHDSYKAIFGKSALGGRLQELIRIRSAQLNGCDLCAAARKDESLSEADIACEIEGSGALDERERLALRVLTLMATDHHKIDSNTFRELATLFSTREVVELLWFCGNCIGTHRFMHALDMMGTEAPIFGVRPSHELDSPLDAR
jgi:alkylhydroperoxidase family enzyme